MGLTPQDNKKAASPSLEVELCGMKMRTPLIMASGAFGYAFEAGRVVDLDFHSIGAVCLKSVTAKPREGNSPPRVAETPAGMLNSVGLQNPGVDYVVKTYFGMLKNFDTKFIGSVAAFSVEEFAEVAEKLAAHESISAVEVNMSCPNVHGGRQFASDAAEAAKVIGAVKAKCKKPVFAKLAPTPDGIQEIARACIDAGANALTVGNTFVGMAIDVRHRRPIIGNNFGGLSGPAIRPLAVYNVHLVHQVASKTKTPIIGCGGVATWSDAAEMMLAGASAVEVGTALFANLHVSADIAAGLRRYLAEHKETDINAIVGALKLN